MTPIFYFHEGFLYHRQTWKTPKEMTLQAEQFEREAKRSKHLYWRPFAAEYSRQCRIALAEYEAHHTPERQSA